MRAFDAVVALRVDGGVDAVEDLGGGERACLFAAAPLSSQALLLCQSQQQFC